MKSVRGLLPAGVSLLLSFSLLLMPIYGAPVVGTGTVVYAERASIGTASASPGTTVFVGDNLYTDTAGSLQVRSGAARVLLPASSKVTWGLENSSPLVTLGQGTLNFSTANQKALVVHVATAVIRPQSDVPTAGDVTILSPKELIVRCSRGAFTFSVLDDSRVVQEGQAYHVVLDPDEATVAAAAHDWPNKPPYKAGSSHFIWFAIAFVAAITTFALIKVFESNDNPSVHHR